MITGNYGDKVTYEIRPNNVFGPPDYLISVWFHGTLVVEAAFIATNEDQVLFDDGRVPDDILTWIPTFIDSEHGDRVI